MKIYNQLTTNSFFNCIKSLSKDNFIQNLTDQQKKIATVVAVAFAFLLAYILILRPFKTGTVKGSAEIN